MSWENIEILDPRMRDLLLPESILERHCTGATWSEGPVYFFEGDYVLWSDIPNNRMLRWSPADGMSVYRAPSNFTNGHTRDREGRLVSCEHGGRRISRTEHDGSVVCVVDNYQGKKLNSPNDVVVKSDGTVWFTDPPYGIMSNEEGYQAESEIGANYVYRFDPETNELGVVADDFDKPNGLAFSPDESLLYISDTGKSHDPEGAHHIRVFDVVNGVSLTNGRVFAIVDPGLADGFRLDVNGNLYTSSEDSIQVYTAAGERIGKIMVPEKIANCTFGGPKKNRLFIAASSSLYSIHLNTQGVQQP
ncbi:SMP-30/gluconolactonase/LRE family protein [Pelagibius sp. Alg239-R121]|uniref:SMP-30/gluconolactonase/LRE family protein n=1 Tax=Pelagibius sp. Alg239-R121 TaxID=2993448 RepID=UPI0024A64447|nr:SMP-30/gluconolactonase/LRE family protein [Pelagibius sp. Alg239-R121]